MVSGIYWYLDLFVYLTCYPLFISEIIYLIIHLKFTEVQTKCNVFGQLIAC